MKEGDSIVARTTVDLRELPKKEKLRGDSKEERLVDEEIEEEGKSAVQRTDVMFEWNEVYYKLKKRISQRACVYYVDALAHVEAIGVPC